MNEQTMTDGTIDDITKKTGGKKPDWRVLTPVQKKDGSFFLNIGAGWSFENEKGKGVSIKLNALPTNSEIVLFEAKEREKD